MTRRLALICLTLLALGGPVPAALADGDPGSDVLVYQRLFLEADSGIPISQQARLGALLSDAQRSGFQIRVAIVATRFDLGAVTGLWRRPRAYARFLGLELSQAYTGRLLVVMPNGFGFNWPGHSSSAAYRTLGHLSISPGASGLVAATQSAVRSLAGKAHVHLALPAGTAGGASQRPAASSPTRATGSSTDTIVAIVAVALAAAVAAGLLARRVARSRGRPGLGIHRPRWHPRHPVALAIGGVLAAGAAIGAEVLIGQTNRAQTETLAGNPALDPGTRISGRAPGFDLTDQFGRPVSLRMFRGKVVLLAFNDSECTTICPLTTTAMLEARAMLGAAGSHVELLGIDANPKATSLEDVLSYSQLHGMLHAWHFLTGSLSQLKQVWKAYGIQAAVQAGEIAHTPALFVISRQGRLARLFLTQQSYAAVGQLGQLLARAASNLLPGHPAVHADYTYNQITGIAPSAPVTLPQAGGGTARLGSGHPRVLLFFATWDRQITGLAGGLEALGRYSVAARRAGLPPLMAVDEGSVEPTGALHGFLASLPRRLAYPVAIDRSGRVADGYQVEGLPWLMVISATGRIVWYYSVAALGWPSTRRLIARVKEALARAAAVPGGLSAALSRLTGSPPALAALHGQASHLLGSEPALATRIRALRGYPVVINAWASWCGPCRSEFGLFASASAQYGKQVAFLGADTADSTGDAHTFMTQHPVSYPSYQISMSGLDWLAPQGLAGLPTTLFVNREGKLVYVHTGQYDSQGTLDADIQSYALAH